MEADEHAADIARLLLSAPVLDQAADDVICWCGQEKQPGEDHSMCWPGM
ncbi:hypothetical protein ACGFZS_47240 [Streptomyces sp. NPDC048288]